MKPTAPAGVSEEVGRVWRRRAAAWPWLTDRDADALLDYCETWISWRLVLAELRTAGTGGLVERQQSGVDAVAPLAELEQRLAARLQALRRELAVGGGAWARR